jgi:hypothetical protein
MVLLMAGCASDASRVVVAPVVDPMPVGTFPPTQPPTQPPMAPPVTNPVARLTGGIGNKVVDSFDQIRAAVQPAQRAIDDCYVSTASEGGWRENLLWNLDIAGDGRVTGVTPHYAEYHRGGEIVPGTASHGLAACMDRALRGIVIPRPVRAGWIRVRFET